MFLIFLSCLQRLWQIFNGSPRQPNFILSNIDFLICWVAGFLLKVCEDNNHHIHWLFFFIFITICGPFMSYKLLPKTPPNKWSVQETKEHIPSMTKEQCQTYQLSHVPFSQICFPWLKKSEPVLCRIWSSAIVTFLFQYATGFLPFCTLPSQGTVVQ